MSKRISNKGWRGRKLLDKVLKPKNDFASTEVDEVQRQHKQDVCKLNTNPDPSFKSTFNTDQRYYKKNSKKSLCRSRCPNTYDVAKDKIIPLGKVLKNAVSTVSSRELELIPSLIRANDYENQKNSNETLSKSACEPTAMHAVNDIQSDCIENSPDPFLSREPEPIDQAFIRANNYKSQKDCHDILSTSSAYAPEPFVPVVVHVNNESQADCPEVSSVSLSLCEPEPGLITKNKKNSNETLSKSACEPTAMHADNDILSDCIENSPDPFLSREPEPIDQAFIRANNYKSQKDCHDILSTSSAYAPEPFVPVVVHVNNESQADCPEVSSVSLSLCEPEPGLITIRPNEESQTYNDCNENDLITLEDLGIPTSSKETNNFVIKEIPNEQNTELVDASFPYTLRYKKTKESINYYSLKAIAFNYASDCSTPNSEGDFSATDGSDYIPSAEVSSDTIYESDDLQDMSFSVVENHVEQPSESAGPPIAVVSTSNEALCNESLENNPDLQSNLLEPPTYELELLPPVSPSLNPHTNEVENEPESPSLLQEVDDFECTIDECLPVANDDTRFGNGRPSRGRKRKCPQNREERKKARYGNKEYYDYKYQLKQPKEFIDFKCKCKKKCKDVVPLQIRQRFFNKFWSLGNYNVQTTFLGAFVTEKEITTTTKKKHFNRKYSIEGYDVCRDMFCQTLKICITRISTAMQKLHSRKPFLDQRGTIQAGMNRTPDEQKQEMKEFIDSIPLYSSHYSREKTSAKFFKPGITLAMVYNQYKEKLGSNAVSFGVFKQFFYNNYNIKVKILSKDTCNMCDGLRVQQINATRRGENIETIKEKKKIHLDRAEEARSKMKADMELAKQQETVECLSFDMEKTLPLPRLQTNLIFYKRQLWFYNLGVHSGKKNQSYCYTWVEGQAGRGAQEIGSCLIKHILNNVSEDVRQLILWSDSCGGQNRNIKITLLMKVLLQMKPSLESITFKYLIPGHSYLPNDKDFGDIERALKFNQRIYTPGEYMDIMRICKKTKPMIVSEMKTEEFYSTDELEKHIINRKKNINKEKINWLKARQIKITKDDLYKIYMKSDFNTDNYDCINISRNTTVTPTSRIINTRNRSSARGHSRMSRGTDTNENNESDNQFSFRSLLKTLWPNGKAIAQPKLSDLQSLFHLIPIDVRPFYEALTGSSEVVDDVDGFNTNLDFVLEDETEE